MIGKIGEFDADEALIEYRQHLERQNIRPEVVSRYIAACECLLHRVAFAQKSDEMRASYIREFRHADEEPG